MVVTVPGVHTIHVQDHVAVEPSKERVHARIQVQQTVEKVVPVQQNRHVDAIHTTVQVRLIKIIIILFYLATYIEATLNL